MIRNLIITVLLILTSHKVNAQLELPLWFYKSVGGDTSITCMDATEGYVISGTTLWVGTNHGLMKFKDFSESMYYDTSNSFLPTNEITAIDVDNYDANLWVGTNQGICRLNLIDSSWTYFNISNSALPSDSITCILAFREDSVWIGTRNGLVLYLEIPDTFLLFDKSNSLLKSNHIQCLERQYFIPYYYQPEPLYAGTDSGFAVIDGSQWSLFNSSNSGLLNNDIRSIATGFGYYGFSNLWIATHGGGITHLFDTTWSSFTTSNALIKTDTIDFIEDAISIVAGSDEDSLYVDDPYFQNDSFFHTFPEIYHPIISVSRQRGNGSWLWVSTNQKIYRADMTEGIFGPSITVPDWQVNITGNEIRFFKLPPDNQNFNLKIYNVLGRITFQKQVHNQSSSLVFNIPDLPQGIYLVQLQFDNRSEAEKCIKTY